MDRLDLELYAERLDRYRERVLDDLAHARMRASWSAFEAQAREHLDPHEVARLTALGILASEHADEDARTMSAERSADLLALERLQVLVERERRGGRGARATSTG